MNMRKLGHLAVPIILWCLALAISGCSNSVSPAPGSPMRPALPAGTPNASQHEVGIVLMDPPPSPPPNGGDELPPGEPPRSGPPATSGPTDVGPPGPEH
jgi:hypothetical protein